MQLDWNLIFWIHFILLLVHQFEEYIYPGGFRSFFNRHIYEKSPFTKRKLTRTGAVIINIFIAWPAYIISAIYGTELLWLALGLCFVTLTNGLLHTILFLKLRKYNPGFVSGLLLFIPFGAYVLIQLFRTTELDILYATIILIVAVIAVPSLIFITSEKN